MQYLSWIADLQRVSEPFDWRLGVQGEFHLARIHPANQSLLPLFARPAMDILIDLNFNFKTEGFLKLARAMERFDLFWVEIDTCSPEALAYIRRGTTIPIASGECLFRRRGYKPYLDADSMDVAIVDNPWNGVGEGLKIAALDRKSVV